MKKVLKTYAIILLHLAAGLVVLLSAEKLKLPSWLNSSAFILIVFIIINIADDIILKLKEGITVYWSVHKLHYLFIGIVAGVIIRIIPTLAAVLFSNSSFGDIRVYSDFSILSILLSLIVVGWEELWFRGLFINYCSKYLSEVHISLIIGLLFMLVHLLNPSTNLLQTGPTLFFAGTLLTLLYLRYRNIWLPLGVHFGNNFTDARLLSTTDNNTVFGADGYLYACILAVLFLYFVGKGRKANAG